MDVLHWLRPKSATVPNVVTFSHHIMLSRNFGEIVVFTNWLCIEMFIFSGQSDCFSSTFTDVHDTSLSAKSRPNEKNSLDS